MSGQPFLRFFPTDWRADPAVRMVSLAARGLWFDMLCLMHEARGFLKIGDRNITLGQLARLTSAPLEEVKILISELEEAGVFSRDTHGSIFCRRMVRDYDRAESDLTDPGARERMQRYRARKSNGVTEDPSENPNETRYGNRNANVTNALRNRYGERYGYVTYQSPESESLDSDSDFDSERALSPLRSDALSEEESQEIREEAAALVKVALAAEPQKCGKILNYIADPARVPHPKQYAQRCIGNALKGRRKEKPPPPLTLPEQVFVPVGSPAWLAWSASRKKPFPTRQDRASGITGWDFASEYPPQEGAA